MSRWRNSIRTTRGVTLGVACLAGSIQGAPTIHREIIGESLGGESIEVWTISDNADANRSPDRRPAIAIIAGLQGHHQIGVSVAESMGRLLIEEHAASLQGRTLYIIPRVNPDGLARFRSPLGPRALCGRAPQQSDADRDRRFDEDPPNDLNGDGLITMMRVPAPHTHYGLIPTHVIDSVDPRIVREPESNETASHALLIEGLDDDGDGRFNEDGWGGSSGGGVDLDMHFPTHWPEHTDGAGRFPLDRPEARAVVQWLQSRGNVAAVIVLGPHDTIASLPSAGRYGADGRVPLGIEEGDRATYEMVAEAFEEITGIRKSEPGPDRAGSLLQWCYADLGVYAFGTPVWVRPDLIRQHDLPTGIDDPETVPDESGAGDLTTEQVEAADREDLASRGVGQMFIDYLYMSNEERRALEADIESMTEAESADLMQQFTVLPADVQARLTAIRNGADDPGPTEVFLASIGAGHASGSTAAPSSSGESADARWLAWIDENIEDGFVDWRPMDHPQLGPVEIGGFAPGIRVNPPQAEVGVLTAQQATFAAVLLDMLPTLEIDEPTAERLGGGIWRVGVTLRNSGTLPTKSAIGVKSRRLHGIVCVIDPEQALETARIVSGPRAVRFTSIDGRGASERAEWLVIADQGDTLELEIRTPVFGTARYTLTMEAE